YIDTSMQPVMHNPERGFVSSANQLPYNYKNYPYYMGGIHALERGYIVNEMLTNMHNITALDMQMMQTDNYDLHARWARPILLKYLAVNDLSADEKRLVQLLSDWNLRCDASEEGASVFASWWDSLNIVLHGDDLAQTNKPIQQVSRTTMLQNLMNDSTNYMFIDDITTTSKVETLQEQVMAAFKKSAPVLLEAAKKQALAWGKFKVNGVRHILKIPSFGRFNLNASGTWNAINAYKGYHGPSWRMIVHLTDETEAYGIYPAGQSGNPGSKYYDSFVNDWVAGKYYKLKILTKQEASNLKDLKGTITISKA
ncbi:MAG TPA: penicillin acylase family protein, partial [Chitinophagaceae bacterium]|nr:penicillin acylase family protein [Chitinophagaceae bacterium]